MDSSIQIIEKPEWVSWDDIKQCLVDAHSINRDKGINMTNYQWPADKIKEFLGEKGVMLVALDGTRIVGTAAIAEKTEKKWYAQGRCAYMCFAGVIPEYSSRGIYKALINKREKIAEESGYHNLIFDTHCHNTRIQEIARKNRYRYVRYFCAKSGDHFSVVMAKWLRECPFSDRFIKRQFLISKILTKIQFKNNGKERGRIISIISKKLRKRLLGY